MCEFVELLVKMEEDGVHSEEGSVALTLMAKQLERKDYVRAYLLGFNLRIFPEVFTYLNTLVLII